MVHINCEDCLKTFRPYRYGIALLRVLMYGFSDWWEFEDERVIEEQFRDHCRDPYERRLLIDKTRRYRRDDSFAEDFKFYFHYLENKRRQNISAAFLCFDCEKYYCTKCVSKHSGHFTFSKDDKYDVSKWRRISKKMLERLNAAGDQKLENMRREQTLLCDVVDVKCEHDTQDLYKVLYELNRTVKKYERRHSYGLKEHSLVNEINPIVQGLQLSNDNKKWLVTDYINKCIKVFNVNDNKMTRRIKLSSPPWGITEIPSTDPSQCLIAVSFLPNEQIHIMNVHCTPAQVISSINVRGECYDLAYCNNKLITLWDYLDKAYRSPILVMNISGEIINIIDLQNLPDFKLTIHHIRMSVHSESETFYVCHWRDPSCVISLSLDGQVLHSVTFTDLEPRLIHVDKDQNVYVMGDQLPIYKLSADLTQRKKIIDKDVVKSSWIRAMRFHYDNFYLASEKGRVYIIEHYSSLSRGQSDNDDRIRSVQFARRAEQLNPTAKSERRRKNVATRTCYLL